MTYEPSTSGQNPALPEVYGYRLQRVLGHGGMSTVYLARQVSLDREIALKVMLPEALTDEISRRRFENEARTIARLDHPNIVGIHEVGRTRDGLPYYAMPYLARGHLGQRDFGSDPAHARSVLQQLLSALEYAHGRGVVHRDVKAENVLFDDAERPLLADFGIALRRGYGTRVTTAGLAVGSTAYMPPEQARGHNVDGRADLYSVGVLGWEMLTGKLPYNAGDALSMALQHAQEPIPRLPPELRHWQKFFDKALAKTPTARFANAREMQTALDKVPERVQAGWRSGAPRMRPGRKGWGLGLAIVALAAAAAVGMFWTMPRAPDATPAASMTQGPASPAAVEPEAPGVLSQASDALDSLMRPVPESAAEGLLTAAATQLQQERWTTPQGDNAYDSLLAAVQADPSHPRIAPIAADLVEAFSDAALRAVRQDDLPSAISAVQLARAIGERIKLPAEAATPLTAALARMDAQLEKTMRARIDAENQSMDRKAAQAVVAQARQLQLPAPRLQALAAAVAAIPEPGESLPNDPGWTLMQSGSGRVAIADSHVSRAEYARFVEATTRASARCRERGSLLRIVAPRDWKTPGFTQSAGQPVVCVSWQDAHAFAQWLSREQGRRYRLATVEETRAAPLSLAKPIAAWADACGATCAQRVAAGRSWRGATPSRPLEGDRGYDDVGFRLVREL